MTADRRKDRILTLIIEKVFGAITGVDEQELTDLLGHPEEDRTTWESLMEPENLMDYISKHFNDGTQSDVEGAKAKFDKLIGKKS